MKNLLVATVLATSLFVASCTQFHNAYDIATNASVSPTAVVVAANGFDAIEASATNYLRLRKCSSVSGPVCRQPSISKSIIKAVRAGRLARNSLEAFLRSHPGALGPKGDYDALVAATSTLQAIANSYNLGAK